jgi:hypothetical protein
MFISRPYDGHVYVVEFARSGAGRANGLRWSRVTIEPIADGERRIDAGIVPKCIRRACRRISSATLGKKAHFCDRHHIAGATAALAPASSTGTAYAVLTFDGFPPKLSPANAGLLCVLRAVIGSIPEDVGTTQPMLGRWVGIGGWS